MVCDTCVGFGVVEKGSVQVLLPKPATVAGDSGNVVEAQTANGFGNLFGRAGVFGRKLFADALEEVAPINEDGDLACAHGWLLHR
jgi:hypothetical protein